MIFKACWPLALNLFVIVQYVFTYTGEIAQLTFSHIYLLHIHYI